MPSTYAHDRFGSLVRRQLPIKIQTEIIEKNGYNLNIPRYVDTSEKEEEIDLGQVVKDMKDIDKEIANVSAELKKSFDELGLEFPFEG